MKPYEMLDKDELIPEPRRTHWDVEATEEEMASWNARKSLLAESGVDDEELRRARRDDGYEYVIVNAQERKQARYADEAATLSALRRLHRQGWRLLPRTVQPFWYYEWVSP